MLFNSYEYIFLFLPIVVLGYFLLESLGRPFLSKLWLVLSSLFFYSWWDIRNLPLLLISILVNFAVGRSFARCPSERAKSILLTAGIIFNVGLLVSFKYYDFLASTINGLFTTRLPLLHLALPLAISFITFQKISYLVDCRRGVHKDGRFLNFALFVTYFPQLIAGPIVLFKELEPQLLKFRNLIDLRNLSLGIFIFSIGLFKKTVLADTYASWAAAGFNKAADLTLIDSWAVSWAYSFQLYFDFSGYTDMAIGSALLMNIRLPQNFNSPMKARNIQDFWGRWHMTLGRFLFSYVYTPLSRFMHYSVYRRLPMLGKDAQMAINIILLFAISGIWHGAGINFIIWGLLHGVGYAVYRLWKKTKYRLHPYAAWFLTIIYINMTGVFFRAKDLDTAGKMLKGMLGLHGVKLDHLPLADTRGAVLWIALGFVVVLFTKNTGELAERFNPTWVNVAYTSALSVLSVLYLTRISEFLYFNF